MARISDRCTPGYGSRLRVARKALGLSQIEVSDRLTIRNSAISKWELEDAQIDSCSRLALEYVVGISREYLRSGDGPMLVAQGNARPRLQEAEAVFGGAVDRWLEVTSEVAAQSDFQSGTFLAMARIRMPESGFCCVMSADRGHESKLIVGKACLVDPVAAAPAESKKGKKAEDGPKWLIYRAADQVKPGSFPPVEVVRGRSLWRVLGVAERLPGVAEVAAEAEVLGAAAAH